MPTTKQKVPLITKFASSPTKPVEVVKQCNKFFINSAKTPAKGPYAKESIMGGKSENSISRKPATLSPIKLPNICNMYAIAEKTPTITIKRVFVLFCFINILQKNKPRNKSGHQKRNRHLHPSGL